MLALQGSPDFMEWVALIYTIENQIKCSVSKLCQTNLIPFLDKINNFLDKGNSADLIYLELSKAFGTVTHGELLVKLKRMRISTRMSIQ